MKKRGLLGLVGSVYLVFILAVIFLAIPMNAASLERVTLTMVSAYPLTNSINYSTHLFKKFVEAWSGGQIKIDFKGGPEVVPFLDIPKVTERGMFDISYTCPNYIGAQYPGFQLFHFPTPANIRICVRDDTLWGLMDKITRNHGMVYLGVWNGDNPTFTIFTKCPPLDKDGRIESLKGLKIRTAGPFDADLASALGGTPVTMHPGELYEALRTKLIDGSMQPINGVIPIRLQDIISHAAPEGLYVMNAMAFMNAKVFDKLSPEAKNLIIEVAKEVQTISYNYTGALTLDGFSSQAGLGKVPSLSFSANARNILTKERRKKLDRFAAAEPNLSKEIIEKFAKYYGAEHLSLSTDISLSR